MYKSVQDGFFKQTLEDAKNNNKTFKLINRLHIFSVTLFIIASFGVLFCQ